MSKYSKNNGWVTFKLPLDINQKLRDLSSKTRLSLTAIVCNGIEREWREFKVVEEIKETTRNPNAPSVKFVMPKPQPLNESFAARREDIRTVEKFEKGGDKS